MLRHLIFVAGLGFLVVLAAVLYAQDRQSRAARVPEEAPAQATPPNYPYSGQPSMMNRGMGWTGRALDRVREQLMVTDEEWIVLQPKIAPVVECQGELRRGMMAWNRFGWDDGNNSPMTQALNELRDTLGTPDSTQAEINSKVENLRKVRSEIENRLQAARSDLQAAVTDEEAAMLVLLGVLD